MKKQINVVGVIIVKNGKILCAQRGYDKSLPELWEFPGGKIEIGESPSQALKREIREELLLELANDIEEFMFTSYEYDFGIVNLTTFICHIQNGEPTLTEHIEIKWLNKIELDQIDWAPADIPTVYKLKKTEIL
ncbi:(deoxy)nucleoside triphosphate pyrophosphohydrolase [Pseudolactococcus carnosus]|uniref:(deoxy)nucleoside triphosphate pyrophosphohydrolase n=1 Tax=Pseudolactococcus carnosus TaxID=2749961 RepID=UPI001FBAE17A|nr:(deoxy)nucleoside triphosphate pyrophosphohydrolase [Lactococcus carnosus]MCJ1978834.1 (deoxy)nucleoside triphosphate pyrophosphohydrolase [Lactococcus carnosus]